MSGKSVIKLIYIGGMTLFGKSVGDLVAPIAKDDISRLLIKASCAATGAYAGVLIANDIDEMISNAINELDDENVEVNDG